MSLQVIHRISVINTSASTQVDNIDTGPTNLLFQKNNA